MLQDVNESIIMDKKLSSRDLKSIVAAVMQVYPMIVLANLSNKGQLPERHSLFLFCPKPNKQVFLLEMGIPPNGMVVCHSHYYNQSLLSSS